MSNSNKQKGMVYLVGAGPGDPGLLTLKGLKCIAAADVLVYDRLVNRRLLSYARPGAEMVYAGKLPDRHILKQEEISRLLLAKALHGLVVTRLKGGDPYLFGRGGEEAELLAENNIPFEVVPGVSAAVSVPAYAGIPVTHRDFTSSFAVITGHEDPSKDETAIAWDKIATGIGTIVFLMGARNLPLISRKLMEYGRPPHTPVALVRWGTRPEQQTLTGCLEDIGNKAAQAGFKSPAVVIVGEVVKLRAKLRWFEDKPFFGKRIVVTRTRQQAGVLAEKIEELGGEPFELPVIEIAEPLDYGPMDKAISAIHTYDWVIFTSVNGVEYFFRRLRFLGKDIRELKGLRICAIGPRTRQALEAKGLIVECVPEEYRAEAVVDLLRGVLKPGQKVLLPRADVARAVLEEAISSLGAIADNVEAYRTLQGGQGGAEAAVLRQMLADKLIHVVTFTSSSTVRNFVKLLGEDNLKLLQQVTLASIGPVTTQTAWELGLKMDVQASVYTIDGLFEALRRHFAGIKEKYGITAE
ncbi:MAG TPA: uroporphyrinogen-III C-methyltransferase [Firmicutes bacterium]|nr:uroporphyrinogen-III C-methyltransferase [Bacillota bacterium]